MTLFFLQTAGGMSNMIIIFAMMVVLIFTMVLPQRKRAKAQTAFTESIIKGQEVVTMSGMIGRVDKIEDKIVTLNVGNKTYIRVTKNSISKELTDAYYPEKSAE